MPGSCGSAPAPTGDFALEDLKRAEEGFPGERWLVRVDLVKAVTEGRRCLTDRHRERLLSEGDQGTAGLVLRLGDRHRRGEAMVTDLFDRRVQLVEQDGIHQAITVRRPGRIVKGAVVAADPHQHDNVQLRSLGQPAFVRDWPFRLRVSRSPAAPLFGAHTLTTSCSARAKPWVKAGGRRGERTRRAAAAPPRSNAAPRATDSRMTPTLRLGRRARACQTDRRIEEKVMARKKDKKSQDKKAQKKQSAQGAPTSAAATVAPSASPRPKKS